ncbi:MAG: HAMP domain-containing sensor histidine kinase [archaeon]
MWEIYQIVLAVVVFLLLLVVSFRFAVKFYVKKLMSSAVPLPYKFLFGEMKEKEQSLEISNEKLAEAIRINQLFTDIIRHDLSTPTGIIKSTAELQLMEKNSAKTKENLVRIKQSAEKLVEMIESASLYSKLEDVKNVEKQEMDLTKTINKIIEDFSTKSDETGIKVKNLSRGKKAVRANVMIEHVFSNLLSNSIKYSGDGKKIEINIIPDKETVRVSFKDWGVGIENQMKDKLFNRFQRADKLGIKGNGLGLAIVKRIVDIHGGKVWIEDNPEGGCVFIVELPR